MMDYLTVEESLRGYMYLLVIVDHFMKLAVADTLHKTAESAAMALWKGTVEELHFAYCSCIESSTVK